MLYEHCETNYDIRNHIYNVKCAINQESHFISAVNRPEEAGLDCYDKNFFPVPSGKKTDYRKNYSISFSGLITVFPRIVSAETILFWI